tara:strand:- start:826 stop:1419 length:594 start_codon:yes stop_codon:yes gene_type:complete
MKRTVICSHCGENFESKGKVPRHKCEDGKTGTGKEIENPKPEIAAVDLEISIPDTEGLHFEEAEMNIEYQAPQIGEIPVEPLPEEPPVRGPQPPKATQKDRNKMEDLAMVFMMGLDSRTYSTEEKASAIAGLYSDAADIRIETAQVVMSARTFGVISAVAVILLLSKDMMPIGRLFQNYGKMFGAGSDKAPDPFGEE